MILQSFLCVFPPALSLSPPAFLRHKEPQVRGNLKAGVARAGRDSGSLIEHALKADCEENCDPLAALADREIRERTVGHGIFHRGRRTRAGTVSAHPGYVCRWGENYRGGWNGKATDSIYDTSIAKCFSRFLNASIQSAQLIHS